MKRPTCPRCGVPGMIKNGSAASGKARWRCNDRSAAVGCGYATTDPKAEVAKDQRGEPQEQQAKNPQFKRKLSGIKRFVVTSAQNATPAHPGFLGALKAYCDFNEAELVVIPLRYKNPTSRWSASQANEERWDRELEPFLYNQRKKLNENLVLLGDIKTVPTAALPLSGFEAMSHGESAIVGHTKLQLKTIPVPQGRFPKILTTTGACTVPNYTDSKAGKKGEFHHTLGAVAVDIVGKKFFLRQINAEKTTGNFIDLDWHYSASFNEHGEMTRTNVKAAGPALGIAFGDTHRAFIDPGVEKATFGRDGIVETLNPEYLVFHDLHDGYAENPHHQGNPFVNLAKRRSGMHDVEKEVRDDVEWLYNVIGKRKGIVVGSNHDNFLYRWIAGTDWRSDPDNAEFYLETALAMVQETKMGDGGSEGIDPFRYWVERMRRKDRYLRTLSPQDSFMLDDIEMALHGDRGPNGSRGSRANLRRIGVKTIIGHSHSPGIEEGCYQTGTSTRLRLEYNQGPSSWMNCHCVVYANGKRSLLFIIDGQWRF